MKRIHNLCIFATLFLLMWPKADMGAQPKWMKDKVDINVAISGAPLYAFSDYTYGAEYFYEYVEFLKNVYNGNIKSKTSGFYSVDAAYHLNDKWAILINAGYSHLDVGYYDPATYQHQKTETDNFFSVLAGGRRYWIRDTDFKLYSALYFGLMLHNRDLEYWKVSNYHNKTLGFQITYLGCQFGKGRLYGVAESGAGDLYMSVFGGVRLGIGYKFQ